MLPCYGGLAILLHFSGPALTLDGYADLAGLELPLQMSQSRNADDPIVTFVSCHSRYLSVPNLATLSGTGISSDVINGLSICPVVNYGLAESE
jgi:hypothetical protein